jgi:hypothetical protein
MRLLPDQPVPWYEDGDLVWVDVPGIGHQVFTVDQTDATPEGQYLAIRLTGGRNVRTSIVPAWKVSPVGMTKGV